MPDAGTRAPTRGAAARAATARRWTILLAALMAVGCADQPPAQTSRAAAPRQRAVPLPGVVDERQNPHRLMLLADNELDLCEGGTGAEKRDACRRRTLYAARAKRLGWCLSPPPAAGPVPSWSPCDRR